MEAHGAPLGPRIMPRWPRRLAPAGDDRLARMVAAGSEEAFAILYERYHQRLYRYCRSMLGNDSDAQDALQSAFAGAFAALASARRDAPVRPWLYRIAHNEAISILRRRRPEVNLEEIEPGVSPSAADVAGQRERLARLVEDLGRLTERQRSALIMRELSGLSHDEIGLALSTDAAGAKQTIFEARRSLQEFAEGREMPCDEVCRAVSAGGGRTLRARRIRSHLHDCASCRAFAAAIPARSRDLRAVAPPLAAAAATGIFRRALSSSSHGSGGGAGLGAGKALIVSAVGKTITGAAVLATVAAGAAGVAHLASSGHTAVDRTGVGKAGLTAVPNALRTTPEPASRGLSNHRAYGASTALARARYRQAHGASAAVKRSHDRHVRVAQTRGRSATAGSPASVRSHGTGSRSGTKGQPGGSSSPTANAGSRAGGRSTTTTTTHPVKTQTSAPIRSSAAPVRTTSTPSVSRPLATSVKSSGLAKSLG